MTHKDLNNNKNCILIFSYTNTLEKELILEKNIDSLLSTNLPIVLITHSEVSKKIINKCDYVLYEKENLIFTEGEILNENLPICESNYNNQYFFGGITTRTYVKKKSYQSAVLNMYINGFNLIKNIGYKYALLWEYDHLMDDESKKLLLSYFEEVTTNDLDGFFVTCKISGINSIYAVPAIIKIDKFTKYCGNKLIKTAKDYVEISKMMICEEWVYEFYKKLDKKISLDYDTFNIKFKGIKQNLISSEGDTPNYDYINSGIFINEDNEVLVSVYNGSKKSVKYKINIYNNDFLLYKKNDIFCTGCWFYEKIDEKLVNDVLNGKIELIVKENFQYDDKEEVYNTILSKSNFDSFKKGKVFYTVK